MADHCVPDRPGRGRDEAATARPMRVSACAGVLVMAILMTSSLSRGEGREGSQQRRRGAEQERLDRIHSEVESLRERLARTEASAGSVLDAIEELDLRVALLARESDSLREESGQAIEREAETRHHASQLEQRVEEGEQALRAFLREAYKVGPTRYLRVVAASASPAQFAAGQRATEALSLGEARRIDEFRADRASLDSVMATLAGQRQEIGRLEHELQAKQDEVRSARRRKEAVLAGLRHEQDSQKRALRELVDMESEVRELVDRLGHRGSEAPAPSLGFPRFRGLLVWPARGRLAVPFGNVRHPRFSTVVPHPGIDIAAPPGQEVRAIFDGKVLFSDWFKGYGDMVVVDHGDGYLSIYGHVSERLVSVGQDVRQGAAIMRPPRSVFWGRT